MKEPHDAHFNLTMIKENKISQNLIGKINNLRNGMVNYYWLLLIGSRIISVIGKLKLLKIYYLKFVMNIILLLTI